MINLRSKGGQQNINLRSQVSKKPKRFENQSCPRKIFSEPKCYIYFKIKKYPKVLDKIKLRSQGNKEAPKKNQSRSIKLFLNQRTIYIIILKDHQRFSTNLTSFMRK